MRTVNNTGTTLLDFLDNDVNIKDVLNKGATGSKLSTAARKTLEDNGLTIGNAGSTVSKDTQTYESIKTIAESLRDTIIELTDKREDSILSKAVETGNTDDAVKLTEDFKKKYNEMLIAMKAMGGTGNDKYAKELSDLVDSNSEALEKIGITKNTDGSLNLDSDTLKAASAKDIKEAFAGTTNFADKIAQKSIYIEANAIQAMYSSSIANYGSSGTYNDSALSSFLQSI